MSRINPFTGEKVSSAPSSSSSSLSWRNNNARSEPQSRWNQQNQRNHRSNNFNGYNKNYNNNDNNYSYSARRPYRVYTSASSKPAKPEFSLKNDNFPTLGGSQTSKKSQTSTMNYSKKLATENDFTPKKKHTPPPKKFVSLVNLKKTKKTNNNEEYETDEEMEQEFIQKYDPMDEELEEYYKTEQQSRLENEDYDY